MPSKPLGTGLRPWKEGRQGGRKERGQLEAGRAQERKKDMGPTDSIDRNRVVISSHIFFLHEASLFIVRSSQRSA